MPLGANERLVKMREHNFKVGQKVHYVPAVGKKENGIVKSFSPNPNTAFVVFACDGDWEHYQNYTGCSTQLDDLREGWTDEL